MTGSSTRSLHGYLRLLCCTLVWIVALAPMASSAQQVSTDASVKLTTSSRHLVTAEMSYLTFKFEGLNGYPRVSNIEMDQADVFFKSKSAERLNGKLVYYLHYQFQAVSVGNYTVPPISFLTNRGRVTSDATTIRVFSKQKLRKRTAEIDGMNFSYYTLMVADKASLYPNETTSVEYKVYLPNSFSIALWGLPQGDKINCTAWRFSTLNRERLHGKARINGKTYQAGHFRSNLTALKPGKASIGPLKGRVVFHLSVMDRGMFRKLQFEFKAVSGKLDFTVKPLPANPPQSFQGDVGNYEMKAAIDAAKKITDNDSIQMLVQLKGKGNLATLSPPLLTAAEGWKVISQNRTDLGEARKLSQGIAEFTYLLQPDVKQKLATETPGLEFAFLQPELGLYKTIKIPGKPITVESTAIADTSSDSKENDLGYDLLIANPSDELPQKAWYKSLPIWLIHLLPLGFILSLALLKARKMLTLRRTSRAMITEKKRALHELEKTQDNFLRAAGNYIEQWVDVEKHPKANEVLQLRDTLCFRPEADASVSQKRRQKILAILRQSSWLVILIFTLQHVQASTVESDSFSAGKRDFIQQQYLPAIDHFLATPGSEKSPDLLFNVGLSYQLNEQPGMAALYYHKALQLSPEHESAARNLAYVEEKNNSITKTKQTDIEHWVATLRPDTYLHLIFFFTGILICLLLIIFLQKPRDARFRVVLLGIIFTPILLGASVYGYFNHPDRGFYQYPSYLVLNEAELTSEPLRSSRSITDIPPASRCRVIAKRGRFSYIRLPNGIQGWIMSKSIASID